MLSLSKDDRVLVFAPHPDDETIGVSGILQESLRLNLPVKVVYFTNGDNNEVSFILYEKHLVLRSKEFIHMGEIRRSEALSSMKLLGLRPDALIFLGYPDFGTMHILRKHWGKEAPFRSMLTRVTKVPYPECLSPEAPYTGESIISDLEKILTDFKPTKIFCSNPIDLNVDHRSLYVFLQVALWNLKGKVSFPEIYPYLVHASHWPKPKGLYPHLMQAIPQKIDGKNVQLKEFVLTDVMVNLKKEMISCYKSQVEYNPPFLYSFLRKNEIFFNYPIILVKRHGTSEIEWSGLEKSFDMQSHSFSEDDKDEKHLGNILFAEGNDFLHIKINLHKLITKERGIDLYLFGYKKDISFSKMPKISLHIGWRSKMAIFDKQKPVQIKDAGFYLDDSGNEIIIKFPIEALNYPDYILSCCRTHTKDLPIEATAWRTLILSENHNE